MSHGHSHDHAHVAADHRGRLAVAFGITAAILVAQAVGALLTGSLALLVDTAHMLTDAGGLALALFAAH
ncbi:MAG TPA: cation transporter, partial [Isoptericola sp.]|nr:cation transporter [Isoptericola sp.]